MSELFYLTLPESFDPEALAPLYPYLPPERQAAVKALPRPELKRERLYGSLLTRYILLSLLRAVTPETSEPPENTDLTFVTAKNGKPFGRLSDGSGVPAFNLSHSHDGILLGVSVYGAIGVDIEPETRRFALSETALARIFSPEELSQLPPEDDPGRSRMLTALWTRKEALAKCTGQGIGAPASVGALDTLTPDSEGRLITGTRDGYLWSVCTEVPEAPNLNVVPVAELEAFFLGREKPFTKTDEENAAPTE